MAEYVCKITPKHPTKTYVTRFYYYDSVTKQGFYRYQYSDKLHLMVNKAAIESLKNSYENKKQLIKIRKKIKRLKDLL